MILPDSLHSLLVQAVRILATGKAVSIVPSESSLTTQEGAALLGVSRPHFVKVLERGDIPYHKVGAHRRVRAADVLDYREAQLADRHQIVNELLDEAQELGLP